MKISDAIREWCDETDVDLNACTELRVLADRIDLEMVELPKDVDGVPIHVGDTVWGCASGMMMIVDELHMTYKGWVVLDIKGFTPQGSGVAHKRYDSLERIADELEEAEDWCDQNGHYDTGIVSIGAQTLHKWSDRIRKLAKKTGGDANDN